MPTDRESLFKSLSLENFKCHENVSIDLPKITLLLGANSSGKSSVLQGLLTLVQSNDFPNKLTLNGKYVQLGGFDDLINKKNHDGSFGINCQIRNELGGLELSSSWVTSGDTDQPKLKRLNLESEFLRSSLHLRKNYIAKMEYNGSKDPFLKDESWNKLNKLIIKFIHEKRDEGGSISEDIKAGETLLKELRSNEKFIRKGIGESIGQAVFEMVKDFSYVMPTSISILRSSIENIDRRVNYISSFRASPSRTYPLDYPGSMKVGCFGENAIFQLLNWQESKDEKLGIISEIARSLELFSDIEVRTRKGGRFEVFVKNTGTRYPMNIVDVGFGVSQILPAMVADCQLSGGSTLCLSQPEVHLHPKSQSLLGDYFEANVNKRGKQYIIETHSEYLINKLRYHIARGSLKESDVAAYYFDRNSKGNVTQHKIVFLRTGEIDGAPMGYFDTYMTDVMNIALEAK